jgi:hypothetical protein
MVLVGRQDLLGEPIADGLADDHGCQDPGFRGGGQ